MFSVPYSRYVFYPITWYSFLIVFGVAAALWLAVREEHRTGLEKDTVIDLALWTLPAGIIGARLYYVIFSLNQFRSDLLSVFRIWEGGIAIYGAVIAGILSVFVFARRRGLSFLLLSDLLAPGLILAQSIGRWGNYFNMEAYGLPVLNPAFCFFPLAVQIPENNVYIWHMATFFYESVWDFCIFCFLILSRRKFLRERGDVFFFYAFLYSAGRFVVEDLRMDSLYATSSVRISQLLSSCVCLALLIRYMTRLCKKGAFRKAVYLPAVVCGFAASGFQLFHSFFPSYLSASSFPWRILVLAGSSAMLILSIFLIYCSAVQEVPHADNPV